MRRSMYAYLTGLVLFVFHSMVMAGQCEQIVDVQNPGSELYSDQWEYGCYSTHREIYDPYGPNENPFAKFYQFILERDADIHIDLNTSSSDASFFLIKGSDKYAEPEYSYESDKLNTRLEAGTYIIEVARNNTLHGTFELAIEYNDVGASECEQPILSGVQISDGWVPGCQTTSRDIADPYNTIPGEGHRAKYFTFNLMQDTDINININSDVDSYLYILQGTGESAVPFPIEHTDIQRDGGFDKENISLSLSAGYYTIELTTKVRYAPGQFTVELNAFSGNSECLQPLSLGNPVSGTWSSNCEIQSWIDGNGNPYQGDSPERANYYEFTLEETTAIRFSLLDLNNPSTIMNVYSVGDYFNKLASTKPDYYWSQNKNEVTVTLSPGTYHLEITQRDRIAIGNYSFTTYVFDNSCSINLGLNEHQSAFLSSICLSQFRINDGDGIDDPYGVQVGEVYYAKRFEFTLEHPTNIRFNGNTGSEDGYLYLAKEVNGKFVRLTETYPEYSWHGTRYPSLHRELDEGRYIIEMTTKYPERETNVSVNLQRTTREPCETYLPLNVRRSAYLGNRSECKSEFKESSYNNYDPYGPGNGWEHFYAKSYTFEITQASNYKIIGLADRFASHYYLTKGGDLKGELLVDRTGRYGENQFSTWLEPGVYTLEYTSRTPSRRGGYSILVWDGTSEIKDLGSNGACINDINPNLGDLTLSGQWSSACDSQYRVGRYAQTYEFNLKAPISISAKLSSQVRNYLFLSKWNGVVWDVISHGKGDAFDANAKISASLSPGKYRIEATTENPSNVGSFTLIIGQDNDGDGVPDSKDRFPDDPDEWLDTDLDGIGNNSDMDDDNDGIYDHLDASPLDENYSADPYSVFDMYFNLKTIEVNENDLSATIEVQRSYSGHAFNIYYYSLDESATGGVDYKPVSGMLTFKENESLKEIEVPLYNNTINDGMRSFRLVLSHPNIYLSTNSNLNVYPMPLPFSKGRSAQILIIDDEENTQERLSVDQSNSAKEETEEVSIIVKRSGDVTGSSIVYYHTLDGTAKAGSDYKVQSGLLKFNQGEEEKHIQIPLINDDIIEGLEYFDIEFSSVEGDMKFNSRRTRIDIEDADVAPEAGAIFFTLNEMTIKENDGRLTLAVERRGGANGDVTVAWQTQSGSAKSGVDYIEANGELTFKDGETHKAIYIDLINNYELGLLKKDFQIILSNVIGSAAVLAETRFTATILDEDPAPAQGILHFSSPTYQVNENGSARIAVNRILGNIGELSGSIRNQTSTGFSAKEKIEDKNAEGDFESFNQELVFDQDEVTKFVSLPILDDRTFEGSEYLGVELLTGSDKLTSQSNVEIIDDEAIPEQGVFRFSRKTYIAERTETEVQITIDRLYGSKGNAELRIKQVNGSAKSGEQYKLQDDVVYFFDGEMSKSITVSVLPEGRGKNNLEFSLLLEAEATESVLSPAYTTIQIMKRKSKKDDGFLGLGAIPYWWLLALLLPLIRIRRLI